MELRDLDYFLRIAAYGHIGRAADALGLTQPALTKSIARLERELGTRVLERTPKGVTVTAFGEQVARHATRVRAVMTDATRELGELATGASGHVRIGTGHAIAQHLLPTICATLLTERNGITLDIVTGTGRGFVPELRNGRLDVVLTGVPIDRDPTLKHEVLMEDRVVVIARKDHPLHRRRRVGIDELARQRWVLAKPGSLLGDWLDQRWREAGISPPAPTVQTDSIATLLGIVAASDLVTFASWSTIRHSALHASLRPVAASPLEWRRKLGATYRDGGYLSSAGRRVIDLLAAVARRENRGV
jgi:DNA-binding transcriptional LysR family regulator